MSCDSAGGEEYVPNSQFTIICNFFLSMKLTTQLLSYYFHENNQRTYIMKESPSVGDPVRGQAHDSHV